jgi:hypothetical protein
VGLDILEYRYFDKKSVLSRSAPKKNGLYLPIPKAELKKRGKREEEPKKDKKRGSCLPPY